jgi:glycosyltransferase involved in cell wall biosynthesis
MLQASIDEKVRGLSMQQSCEQRDSTDSRRLLLLVDEMGGGTGEHIVSLTSRWRGSGWDVRVVTPSTPTVRTPPEVQMDIFPRQKWLRRYPIAQMRRMLWLWRYVREFKPDVVHTYFFWSVIYGRILKRMGKVRRLIESREDQGFNWGAHEYALLRATRGIPNEVICVSEAVRQMVVSRERLDPQRVQVIHNGIACDAPFEGARLRVRQGLGLDAGHLVVGTGANLNRPIKGGKYLVEAIPLVVQEVPNVRFVVVGLGNEIDELKRQAESLGVSNHLIFAGFRKNISDFYAAMDVSALTSLSEGLSITILESMSHGLPVVATAVGGNPEVVADGQTGFLVPPKDPQAFASRVIALLQDSALRRRMGEAGRRRIEEHFRMDKTASEYLKLYERLRR